MAEIDDLIKDIDDVLGNKEEPQTKEVEVKDETNELISEIESVLSPQQPAEEKPKEEIPQAVTPEKPKEELPKAVPSALPAPTPVKEPEVDLSKPSNIVLSVIGDKDEEEFTPADRDLIKSLDAADLNEFTKGRPDVFLDDDQKRQIFNYQRELRKSSPYGKIPTNWEEWYNLGAAASEDLADVGVMTEDLLGSALKGTAKAVKQGAPALLGMNSGYAEALAAEKLLPEDKKAEVENWRKRAWQIANTPVKGGEKQNPDAYTDAKYLAKIKEYLTPEQVAGIEKEFQEKRYQAKQVPFSYTSELASLPESVAFLGTKLGTGGMQLWDDASEKFGLTDEETSFERFKARSEVDTAQAKLIKSEPKSWARVVDTYYAPVMKSFSSLIHPSIDEYMIMYPDLSREEAQSKRQADIESGVLDTIEGIKKSIPENEPDIATFGSLTIPGQFGVDVFGYAYSVVQASKMLTPIAKLKLKKLGLDDDQINALETKAQGVAKKKELSKLEKLQKPGLVERAAGATARGIEKTGDYLERSPTWQTITKAAPAVTGATIGYQVNPENPFAGLGLGALSGVGAKYGVKTLVDIPKVIKEVQAARRISAGGSVGPLATLGAIAKQQDEVKTLTTKLKTLAEGTDEYVETKKALDVAKERVKGEGIVDYEGIGKVSDTTKRMLRFVNDDAIANIGEYARLGVEPTLIALATGVIDSSDEDELKTMIGQGLAFSLGGRAVQQSYHKFLGEDPVIAARRAKQANVDALKAYRDSTPETKGEIDKLTDWDLVIGRQAKKVADTEAEVQKLVNESPDAKKIEDAEKRLEAEKKSLSLLKTANVQTRNEFGRQFLNQLGRNNALLNGTLRAGQNNVGINILSTQQIFDHFRKNPQWQNVPDEVLMEYASQQGFYSGTGGTEFRPGVNVSDAAKGMTFDPAKPSIVINSDALRNRIELFGETPIDALNHETGHAILRIKEIQDAVADASKLLFTNEITDASGNVKEITTGLYSEEQLNSLFKDQYLKNRSKDEIARLGAGLGLWDTNTNSLNKKKVANYMQEEILAELFSNTLSRNLGKNIDSKQIHLLDIARLKLKNKLFKNAVTKMLGFGMDGDVFFKATGATLTPDAQSASRNALRILQSINGDVTTIAEQPETAPISKADIRKSKIAAERYGMDSGLFATKVQAQVFDADGNPVGDAVDVTDPSVFEGSWRISKDGEERLSGYGQIPLELRQLQVPEGGTLSIKKKIITEVDGVTPKLLKPSDLRKIKKDRATLFKQAIDTPDYGTPGRFEPVSEGSESYRGTFTPAQIKAIQELPEGIVPLKIKKYLLELNEAIVRRDGTRFFVDYAAVMDDNGNYKAFSPKIYDVVPIGLQLSTAGNFLVTTISVGRMMSKLNAWSDRMPNRLSPWNGSKEAFWNEFSTRYLDNWSKGIQGSGYNERGEAIGSNQLSDDVAVAEQKKSIFNDFLNLFKNETEVLNLDRTKIPKRKGDEKNKSIDRTIMSMRIDHMAELLDAQDLPKLPIDYGKALINFLPAETAEIEAPSGERGFQSKLQMEIQRNFKGAKATPEQLKAVVNNPQNVKAEEVKWSGVNDAIDRLASENNGKVPVQELLNYLRDEGQVKFEEVTLGGTTKTWTQDEIDTLERQAQRTGNFDAYEQAVLEFEDQQLGSDANQTGNLTKFAKYQLPGGENYREVVMAMPYDLSRSQAKIDAINKRRKEILNISKEQDLFKRSQTDPEAKALNDSLGAEFVDLGKQADQLNADIRDGKTGEQYTSSHFPEIPNYVAHMRLNERTDAEGNDGLFIEELQSDRHQAGREKGYVPTKEEKNAASNRIKEIRKLQNDLDPNSEQYKKLESEVPELGRTIATNVSGKIPDAPFRTTWPLQLFKRALRDAVANGKTWIGWTTGDTQAERYDLSKQIGKVVWNEDTKMLTAYDPSQKKTVIQESNITSDKLSDYVGKEVAQKLVEQSPDEDMDRQISGLDLKVGGEGMKGFYDTILPKELGKYVSKMGGKVEKSEIVIEKPSTFTKFTRTPNSVPEIINVREKTAPIWRVNITPQMENVVRAGQLQFMPAEVEGATPEPEGLQGIELPQTYRRISDMIPPLRDIEPPVRPSVEEKPLGEIEIGKQVPQVEEQIVEKNVPVAKEEIPVAKVELEDEVADTELISTGIDVPESVDEQSVISSALRLANSKPWKKGRDFKLDIQQRVLDAAEKAGVKISERTLETIEYLTRVGLKDGLIALEQNPNAIGWYDEKTKQALGVMSLLFPEIATDENARFAFTWALAVTSNGLKVDKNFELAEKVYRAYRKTGKMPSDIQAGQAQGAINQSLELFNQLTKEWGIENTRKFMQTEFTVQEISRLGVVNNATGNDIKPGGEYADTSVRGASILGPKIGNGFFSNLYGLFDALTMDRWLVRTWGRWTGTLVELNPELTQQATTRMQEAVTKLTAEDKARFDQMIGKDVADLTSEELAVAIQKASMKPKLRDVMNQTETGEELRKSGNGLAKYLDGQKEAPASPAERNFIREIFGLMLDELKSDPKYADLTMADLQAVLWYAEKRLYETAKVKADQDSLDSADADGYEDDDAPDYANAAIGVAREKGVSEKRIKEVLEKIKNDRTTTTRLATEGRGEGETEQQKGAGGFAGREKQKFKQYVAVSTARRNRTGNEKVLWTYTGKSGGVGGDTGILKPKSKKNLGVKYISEWKPGRKLATMFRNNQLPVVKFLELDSTDKPSAQKFADTLQQSKEQSEHGAAVYVYPTEDYQNMKLFMSESGKSGFAVKPDGDIISVFSMEKGSGRSIMEAAIAAGGKKLDAFDTILPQFYGTHGFVEAARIPWNDEFSPEGWDKQTFQEYNNGEPDVVMMVLDPKYTGDYTPRTDIYATDYDAAVQMQDALLQKIEKSGKKKK